MKPVYQVWRKQGRGMVMHGNAHEEWAKAYDVAKRLLLMGETVQLRSTFLKEEPALK